MNAGRTMTTTERLLTLPAAVETWAESTPGAPAIVTADAAITFGELRAQMNRVANFLLQRGVTRGHRVGLYMRRGEAVGESLPLILGILKVAAYVPLDANPGFPAGRLAAIMQDAEVEHVLTHRRYAPTLERALARGNRKVTVLCMDELRAEIAASNQENPPEDCLSGGDDLAYIIFTSGTSTGKPKGVRVGHRSLAHYAVTQNAVVGIRPGDRATQFFALTFDASLSDLSMLAAGATLYPLPPNALLGGQALLSFLQERRITVGTFIPTVWMTLPAPSHLPELRTLMLGGEVCPAGLVQKSARPGLTIYNACGLTETTVVYALGECANDGRPPSIGRPLPGVAVSIRDERLRRVPPGVEGQICVGDAARKQDRLCLAWGYTDPQITAARFVPDPEASDSDQALFLTLDAGVMDESGTIWFKGRMDQARRLKVSGKLVSLDEVEELLLHVPEVSEAAVEHFAGRIVAYVSLRPGTSWSAPPHEAAQEREVRQNLDRYLRQFLPDYMRPKGYAVLSRLPRTSSDKLDRNYLRDEVVVTWVSQDDASTFVQASTRAEQVLAEIIAAFLTEELQESAQATRALSLDTAWEVEGQQGQEVLPRVSWQEVNISLAPSEMGIESAKSPVYALEVAERLGVEVENRELFCPLRDTASAIEFLLAQAQEADGNSTSGKG
jgi:amino acid adenylation domain-containing protein